MIQPFISAVGKALPLHRHAGNPMYPVDADYSHCSAVECLYYATHYTPDARVTETMLKLVRS